jgi:signal transduction histidine kinase
VVLLLEVTHEREMARRMAAFERRAATGDLLMSVAHEVRNPLAAVQASAEALRLEVDGKAEETALVDIIRQQVDRLTNLMRDLLDVARPSPSSLRRRESLGAVCRAALEVWKQNPARRPRQVHLHVPAGDELHVMIDHARIEQVLFNLLDNAAEHSGAGQPIEVDLERRVPGLVRVRIADHGTGVPPAALGRLFEPFFTTRPNGTGLGLAIVKQIVEAHGGSVAAESSQGTGATFTFTLPSAPEG